MTCKHEQFSANVRVARLAEKEGDDPTHFVAEVTVKCAVCETPFEFKGLPDGINFYGATASMDALTAHLSIMPQGKEVPPGLIGLKVTHSTDTRN